MGLEFWLLVAPDNSDAFTHARCTFPRCWFKRKHAHTGLQFVGGLIKNFAVQKNVQRKSEWNNKSQLQFSDRRTREGLFVWPHDGSREQLLAPAGCDSTLLIFIFMFFLKKPNWSLFSCVGRQIAALLELLGVNRLFLSSFDGNRSVILTLLTRAFNSDSHFRKKKKNQNVALQTRCGHRGSWCWNNTIKQTKAVSSSYKTKRSEVKTQPERWDSMATVLCIKLPCCRGSSLFCVSQQTRLKVMSVGGYCAGALRSNSLFTDEFN